jgi:hypothetical protein
MALPEKAGIFFIIDGYTQPLIYCPQVVSNKITLLYSCTIITT